MMLIFDVPPAFMRVTVLDPRGKPYSSLSDFHPEGRPSSSSAKTTLVYRAGPPYIAIVPDPGMAPPTFIKINLRARPILPPAGCIGSGPRQPYPELRRICLAIDPLTINTG